MCTFSLEQRQAQGKAHSSCSIISPISQMKQLRPGEKEPLLIAIHELVRKLQDKGTELSPYYMPGL